MSTPVHRLALSLCAALTLSVAAPAVAQMDDYEARFGPPVDVALDDLVGSGASYQDRAVRTKGRLEMVDLGSYAFRTLMYGQLIRLIPVQEVSFEWEQAARSWIGRDVEIVGVFQANQASAANSGSQSMFFIQFWRFTGPAEEIKGEIKATDLTLEQLVDGNGRWDGKMVRVRGQFRGRNLYGDLPSRSMRDRRDWLVKDDMWSVWVGNRKPKGDGFDLDVDSKRDTAKWVEVYGKPFTRAGIVYIEAVRVLLSKPPSADKSRAQAAPTPPPPPRPVLPPVVVFTLPVEGEPIAPDGRLTVQFSKDMDERTFAGRVQLRYAGPRLPGDRDFVGLRLIYEGGLKALIVDPGDALRPGRTLELLLLPGITDLTGRELVSRPGGTTSLEAAEIVRFRVGS
ncbi:MAG: Ig-like domain-containing protein [Vicinamibacteria bacterium]|nr:Ig-like domain-containing protein [Vicinamibacteria bacterium]